MRPPISRRPVLLLFPAKYRMADLWHYLCPHSSHQARSQGSEMGEDVLRLHSRLMSLGLGIASPLSYVQSEAVSNGLAGLAASCHGIVIYYATYEEHVEEKAEDVSITESAIEEDGDKMI